MKKVFASIIIFTIAFILLSADVYAFSLSVDPPSFKIKVKPGTSSTGTIKVKNEGDAEIGIKAYLGDWVFAPDGGKTFKAPATTVYSATQWVTISPDFLTLQPKEVKDVNYTIKFPENIQGGKVTVIFFETALGTAENEEGMTVKLAGRIGVIGYIEAENASNRIGEITKLEVSRPDENKPLTIKLKFKNTGDTYTLAKATANIIDQDGNVYGNIEIDKINTLPGDEIEKEGSWMGQLPEGQYDLIVTIDMGEENIPVISESKIIVTKSAEITDLNANSLPEKTDVSLNLKNTGNLTMDFSEGNIEILNVSGAVVAKERLQRTILLPDTAKEIKSSLSGGLVKGKYKVVVKLTYDDKVLQKETTIEIR